MENVALIYAGTNIYWSSIVIALAAAASCICCVALCVLDEGNLRKVFAFIPLAFVISIILSRALHYYCHYRQYASLMSAMTDYSQGAFSLTGALTGTAVAALAVGTYGKEKNTGRLFDYAAVAGALGIGIGRFSAMFNTTDRGKVVINSETLHGLPWSTAVAGAGDSQQWRTAVFCWEGIGAFIIFLLLLLFMKSFSQETKNNRGMVFWLFLLLYGTSEFVFDSMRYDSSFFRSNGFVSIIQIIGGISMLTEGILFSALAIKRRRFRWWYVLLWVLILGGMGAAGYMEYYVQRHGDLYLLCYGIMTAGLLVTTASIFALIVYCITSKELPQNETVLNNIEEICNEE